MFRITKSRRHAHGYTPSFSGASYKKGKPLSTALKTAVLWLFILSAVSSVAVAAILLSGPNLDAASCEVGKLPETFVMIVTDLTDEASPAPAEWRKIVNSIEAQRDALKTGDRLSILALMSDHKDAEARLHPIFSGCKPKHPDEGNWLFESIQILKRQYAATWQAPLQEAIQTLEGQAGRGAKTSPLMASLKEIGAMQALRARQRRTLYLFSDLLEHSDALSHYRRRWPGFAKLEDLSRDEVDVEGLFAGVEVLVFQLTHKRVRHLQTRKHSEFWSAWLQAASANYRVKRI